MEPLRHKCSECENTYKNKSSLKRHINTVHFHRRFVCGQCNKEYVRNIDFLKHRINCHQPIILKQNEDNVIVHTPPSKITKLCTDKIQTKSTANPSTTVQYNIEDTTALLNGQTANQHFPGPSTSTARGSQDIDWYKILNKDLEVSPSESGTPKLATTATNTDVHHNPAVSTEVNTSPLCILDMETNHQTLLTTHDTSGYAKEFLKLAPKTTTQIGCVPLIRMRDEDTQTDKSNRNCQDCDNEEHLILQRQAYIRADAYRNIRDNFHEPITSREDRARMSIPNKTSYNKWLMKLQRETKPKSPGDFQKVKSPILFNNPEIKITSKEQNMGNPNIRKPKALTVDHEVYTAICSRKPTRPMLATSPRKILLPPPREEKWSYTTTKF